jgi:predicted GIY-YIG superfamily endonuclease
MGRKYYVYEITFPDSAKYIGMTSNPEKRFYVHTNTHTGTVGLYKIRNNIQGKHLVFKVISTHETKKHAVIDESNIIVSYLEKYPLLNKVYNGGRLNNFPHISNKKNRYDGEIANSKIFIRVDGIYQKIISDSNSDTSQPKSNLNNMKIPTMPDRTVIGAEIKRLKEAKGITVVDLGRAICKPRQTVYNIMDGNASYDLLKLTLDTLDRWGA